MDIEAFFTRLGSNCWKKIPGITRVVDSIIKWFTDGYWRIPGNPNPDKKATKATDQSPKDSDK